MESKIGYNTRQAEQVGNCLKDANGVHLTAENICDILHEKGIKIGTATVYRNLEKLINKGLVRKYTGTGTACFSWTQEGCSEHFHLKCVKCGKLIHIECDHMDDLSEHINKDHGFAVDKSKTVLYGLCGECNK